ncbi:MAG: glycosyltransferase family 4 protein [Gaiellaceae bacterium MAG52_C11]|nr:glycosyltransferase family 4 protein [Candidatus Gaiellasilicea maunaloa]
MRDAVEHARAAGVEIEVVSPADFRHFGIAYGHGIVGNLRRRPWLVLALPLFLAGFVRAARRAARDADLVHAHWLPSGLVAALTGKPYLVQLWGTDVELARRAPWLARPILRRAQTVVGTSNALIEAARELGARHVELIPTGVELPPEPAPPSEPPRVLFAGRLSPEKGIEDFLRATDGFPRVILGSGPVAVPEAVAFVPPSQVGEYYERAAVVCVPSRREGVGMTAREAMAHGRPVVATAVGGLPDAIRDGETGLLVPPRDPLALRNAIERLLDDAELRARLGSAARAHAEREFSWRTATASLVALYGRTAAS